MQQQGSERKSSEQPTDAQTHVSAHSGPTGALSHSRVGSVLGWLQELLLLVALAVVCSSCFDISNGRLSDHLDDVVSILRISALVICVAILIGLYLSIFHRPLRSSTRARVLSPCLESSTNQSSPSNSLSNGAGANSNETHAIQRAPAAAATACGVAVVGRCVPDDIPPLGESSPRDAPSSYSPTFVSQLRGQLVNVQHQLYV